MEKTEYEKKFPGRETELSRCIGKMNSVILSGDSEAQNLINFKRRIIAISEKLYFSDGEHSKLIDPWEKGGFCPADIEARLNKLVDEKVDKPLIHLLEAV